MEIKARLNVRQAYRPHSWCDLSAECDEIQLTIVHGFGGDEYLTQRAGYKFTSEYSRPCVWRDFEIVFFVNFGIDVGVIGHLCCHVRPIKYLCYLQFPQRFRPYQNCPHNDAGTAAQYNQRFVSGNVKVEKWNQNCVQLNWIGIRFAIGIVTTKRT